MEDLNTAKKRGRDETESVDSYSDDVKRLRENLLDASDDEADLFSEIPDLDSFIKSFQDEITGESRPDLGYLLGASDDELGIPPTTSSPVGLDRFDSTGSDELGGEFWDDSFGFGIGESSTEYDGEYVWLDGLFDYSGLGFGPGDYTLPAQ